MCWVFVLLLQIWNVFTSGKCDLNMSKNVSRIVYIIICKCFPSSVTPAKKVHNRRDGMELILKTYYSLYGYVYNYAYAVLSNVAPHNRLTCLLNGYIGYVPCNRLRNTICLPAPKIHFAFE